MARGKGRPTDYTKELSDKICQLLSEGKSLRTVCKQKGMPSGAAVFRWLRTNEDFREQYEKAKQESADAMAEEILDISDDSKEDFIEITDAEGNTKVKLNKEYVQRSRLRVDTRKWLMSKMKPKKYGEKLDVTSQGDKVSGFNFLRNDNNSDNKAD